MSTVTICFQHCIGGFIQRTEERKIKVIDGEKKLHTPFA
jgi:hypothetical protein